LRKENQTLQTRATKAEHSVSGLESDLSKVKVRKQYGTLDVEYILIWCHRAAWRVKLKKKSNGKHVRIRLKGLSIY